jgi:hypothetical protein
MRYAALRFALQIAPTVRRDVSAKPQMQMDGLLDRVFCGPDLGDAGPPPTRVAGSPAGGKPSACARGNAGYQNPALPRLRRVRNRSAYNPGFQNPRVGHGGAVKGFSRNPLPTRVASGWCSRGFNGSTADPFGPASRKSTAGPLSPGVPKFHRCPHRRFSMAWPII